MSTDATTEHRTHPVVDGMKAAGGWNPLWDGLYEMDPDWTEQYMAMAMEPFQGGVLDAKTVSCCASRSTPRRRTCTVRAPADTCGRPWTWE